MIRKLDPSVATRREYDCCIIGAGAAGITIALELASRGWQVCLLEAGGASFKRKAQRLLDGKVIGDSYPPLARARLSGLGGSTQVWAGWCRPLDPIDFEARPELGSPGWPLAPEEIVPFYQRAHSVCGLGDFQYQSAVWERRLGLAGSTLQSDGLENAIFHIRALDFGAAYRPRMEHLPSLDVWLHAPVLRLGVDASGAVPAAWVRAADGVEVPISAGKYVLAAGGIENARLLLLSARYPQDAPGNAYGLVGRFFSDHPFVNPGWLVFRQVRRLPSYFPRPVQVGAEATVCAALSLPASTLRAKELPGAALILYPQYEAHSAFDDPAVRAALELRDRFRARAVPGGSPALLRRALRRPDRVAIAALRKLLTRTRAAATWRVRMMFEPASHPSNRVELDEALDAAGRRRARVHWRLSEPELDAMSDSFREFDAALCDAGLGRLELSLPDNRAGWRAAVRAGKHHLCATRMHHDPRHGVVDADGRVHGVSNLFVAGSSVFSSPGYVNPTLTIVALALRLADHLRAGATRADMPESSLSKRGSVR